MRMSGGRNAPKAERSSSKSADAPAKKSGGKITGRVGSAVPQPPKDESASYNVRKIHNGYIVSESRYDTKKGYISRDTYVPTRPVITIGPSPKKGE